MRLSKTWLVRALLSIMVLFMASGCFAGDLRDVLKNNDSTVEKEQQQPSADSKIGTKPAFGPKPVISPAVTSITVSLEQVPLPPSNDKKYRFPMYSVEIAIARSLPGQLTQLIRGKFTTSVAAISQLYIQIVNFIQSMLTVLDQQPAVPVPVPTPSQVTKPYLPPRVPPAMQKEVCHRNIATIQDAVRRFNKEHSVMIDSLTDSTLQMLVKEGYLTSLPQKPSPGCNYRGSTMARSGGGVECQVHGKPPKKQPK